MEVAEKERHLCVFGPSNGKHVHSTKKGIKDQSGSTSHHLLRQSSRRGRGRMKGSRPVGRPPLVTIQFHKLSLSSRILLG